MPRYFFDIDDGYELRDEVGQELDAGGVRTHALQLAAARVAGDAAEGNETVIVVGVRDESDTKLLSVRLVNQVR